MTYMPRFKLPATSSSSYEGHTQAESALLAQRCQSGLDNIFANAAAQQSKTLYSERLNAELQIIERKAFSAYFLIVADYVQWAKENGISVGPGRGSGPCSLVGFVLGITTIDPIKYELPFERFLNPDRDAIPDFDLDFCSSRYTEVVNYLRSKYGSNSVAQLSSDDGVPLPSRLVVCDRPIRDLAPVLIDPVTGMCSLPLNRQQAIEAGLVQFNVINQPALTKLQSRVEKLARQGIEVDLTTIALNDTKTFELLGTGKSTQLETLDEQYEVTLSTVAPDKFQDLYAAVALSYSWMQVRLREFVQRKHNPESVEPIHPLVDGITRDTYGLILYQEQILQIAHRVGGLTYAQADTFRRLTKKNTREGLRRYKSLFLSGAEKHGFTHSDASELYEQLGESCRVSFTKSHAISFALIAYQEAWLKAHYS